MTESTHADPSADKASSNDPAAGLGTLRFTLPLYDVPVGPFSHLHEERARLAALRFEHFEVTPMGSTIGAEITGVDLTADLSDDVIAEIRAAWLAFKVVFFRDQSMTSAQHVALGRRFGELEIHPFLPPNAEQPELVRFEKGPELGGYENGWHSDVTWRETPSMGALLHGIEVPTSGGDTLFADMAAAYGGLDAETRELVDGLTAIHDYSIAFGHGLTVEAQAEMREKYPPVRHPVVRTHPETGTRMLYVNRYFTSAIVGMGDDEGHELIDRLSKTAEQVEFQCRFHWTPNAVAFWDNRAVQHYASSDYWPTRRVMERASIIGDRPY